MKMPHLQMSTFYGDSSKWLDFWNQLECTVRNNGNLSKAEKFTYLKSLLSGNALAAISGIVISDRNPTKQRKRGSAACSLKLGKPQEDCVAIAPGLLRKPCSLCSKEIVVDTPLQASIRNHCRDPPPTPDDLSSSPAEIEATVKSPKRQKSPRPDGLFGDVVKEAFKSNKTLFINFFQQVPLPRALSEEMEDSKSGPIQQKE
ncbi:hypothetical protein AVEN_245828-1 [Araneus ventricosus]|uniref:Uncharacterized protein n=1 Tax=Araneus ventricosus TaxID=182803 RepID=A0A4Y2E8C8_ARAVE|nr:hypothetical protein AVEN_245828-1 [Araneus ventricosus]